ncbi:LuxR C-terminal-related transcriptional regulator [Streptomyces sp. NRRL S-87]|uniref:LuxR C-terminal-related transcriptional regulator n=1 Tax=Streptomyces sp. NRRL S-87 TaxID=1463920 RepID=UPI0004C150A9|nr:LuxR C-terminal-related transcriptional regulator [Streptomyces sp. NRRL S-87]
MLSTLGLETDAELVYRAMLRLPRAGVPALAGECALSEDDVRAALDQLSTLALVRPSHTGDGSLRAVSPEVGMELLMVRQQAEIAAQQQRLEQSRAAAAQLIAEYADLRPATAHPGVEQLLGLDEIRDRLARLTREVREEVVSLSPGGAQTPENLAAARPLDEELLGRGVRMRTIYLASVRNDRPTVEYADWLASRGGQVRTLTTLPTRMIIVDRATAVIPVSSDDTAAGAVVLTGQGTLSALTALFEGLWSAAEPLGSEPASAPPEEEALTPQLATVLRFLADGHTDDAIAKRLGVSSRTARRLATELMDRLGARSRFEAGARAVQRGWLPMPR